MTNSANHHARVLQDKQYLWHPFTPQQRWIAGDPTVIVSGSGCYLIDDQGHKYLDAVSSLWTTVHGHNHPVLNAAIEQQLKHIAHSTMLGLTHPTAIELARRLVSLTPKPLARVFYSDSGSTATEIAIKMAFQSQQHRGHLRRTKFATLVDAYHGDTLGAVSVGGIDLFHHTFKPLLFNSLALPAPRSPGGEEERDCLTRALEMLDAHAHELAGFIFEPLVQGAAGMKMHSASYINTLAEHARSKGLLLIADEVAVGFGRTGTLFACEKLSFSPDFLCLAKGITGGYLPLAATLATEAVYEDFLGLPEEGKQFFHGHTYTGNPLACAVAIASLDIFEQEQVLEHTAMLTETLGQGLAQLKTRPWVSEIRQHGVLVGIDLCHPDGGELHPSTGHKVAMASRPLGAILRPLGNTLVLNPPLCMTRAETLQLLKITDDACAEVFAGVP